MNYLERLTRKEEEQRQRFIKREELRDKYKAILVKRIKKGEYNKRDYEKNRVKRLAHLASKKHCDTCNVDITVVSWSKHQRTKNIYHTSMSESSSHFIFLLLSVGLYIGLYNIPPSGAPTQ